MATISDQELLDAEARMEARRRRPIRLLLIFLAAFFTLQYVWEMSRDTQVERAFIDQATVAPAAWLIDGLWPGQAIRAEGHRLVSPHGRLNVLNGCEGLETLFLLMAAVLAYPFPWRALGRPAAGHPAGLWPEPGPAGAAVARLPAGPGPVRPAARHGPAPGHGGLVPAGLPVVRRAP